MRSVPRGALGVVLVLVLAVVAIGLLWKPSTPPPPPPAAGTDFDTVVREALDAWGVPGAAVAVVRGDEVVYLAGHGVREVGSPERVTPDTLFPIASCTKAFTTTAMAMLVDDGKMRWDDPVRMHVPYFRLHDPVADAAVTLRDLVTHRTGVRSHDLLWYRSPLPQEELIRRVEHLKLDRPFRTTFQYQSVMFTTAGHAVTSASGTPWGEFVEHRIFRPLEMKTATVTTAAAEKAADRATGHRRGADGRAVVMPWYRIETPDAAGSVCASVRDLAQWARFQLGDGTFAGQRLVSSQALAETHTPQVAMRLEGVARDMNPDTLQMSYGLGWLIYDYRGHLLWAHAGTIDGFRTYIALAPREKLAVVLVNNLDKSQMNLPLTNTLLDSLLELPRKDWNAHFRAVSRQQEQEQVKAAQVRLAERRRGTRSSRELAAYAGVYEEPAYGRVEVVVEKEALLWKWDRLTCPLEHFHFDTFVPQHELLQPGEVQCEVQFLLDAEGTVSRMSVTGPLGVEFRRVK